MISLSIIPGIGKTSLELLDAAGFSDAESLAKAGADELTHELARANAILKISKRAPGKASIEKWIQSARDLTSDEQEVVVEASAPVNYEKSPQAATMIAHAPFAIPLPARHLVENQLTVSEIPSAILLNRYSGDLDVRIEARVPSPKTNRSNSASTDIRTIEHVAGRLEIDVTKIKNVSDVAGVALPKLANPKFAAAEDERIALICAPLAKTNEGRDPNSQHYVRGVLHTHPISMRIAAIVTLLIGALLPMAILSSFLLLLSEQSPNHFAWVPKWLLVFPIALPVVGLFYAILGASASCRICGQKQLIPNMCLKNAKAHHIRGLGYIIPACLHMLFYSWFRCIYCGTPVRLKK